MNAPIWIKAAAQTIAQTRSVAISVLAHQECPSSAKKDSFAVSHLIGRTAPFVFKSHRTISDPDECMDANGGCHQLCVNLLGTYECRCHAEGFVIGEDGQTCIGTSIKFTSIGYLVDWDGIFVPAFNSRKYEDELFLQLNYRNNFDPSTGSQLKVQNYNGSFKVSS